jgi:hypothetical protein
MTIKDVLPSYDNNKSILLANTILKHAAEKLGLGKHRLFHKGIKKAKKVPFEINFMPSKGKEKKEGFNKWMLAYAFLVPSPN